MQSEHALQIPHLKKWAEQATRKAEDTKRISRHTAKTVGQPVQREVHWEDNLEEEDEEDGEMRRQFIAYRVKLIRENEERRAQERAAYMQAEKEKQQKEEDRTREEIQQKAIDDYKKKQNDMKARNLEREGQFKEELARLGLEADKIQSIIETSGFGALEWDTADETSAHSRHLKASIREQDATKSQDEVSPKSATVAPKNTRSSYSWYVHSLSSMHLCQRQPRSSSDSLRFKTRLT